MCLRRYSFNNINYTKTYLILNCEQIKQNKFEFLTLKIKDKFYEPIVNN